MSELEPFWKDKIEQYEARAERSKALEPEKNEEPLQLPMWPEPQRVAPNAILRSALFGVVRRGKRRMMQNETLWAWSGSSIEYKGEQLDQYDLDVWLQAIQIACQQDLSGSHGIRFTARGFLKAMGRKYNGNAANTLRESFLRMIACAVVIKVGGVEYAGNLVSGFYRHKTSGCYVLHLNNRLRPLFDAGTTRLDWATRLALPSDLARWMQGYVSSHRATRQAPHRISVAALRDLSGSATKELRKFRQQLRGAMELLTTESQVVTTWRLTDQDALEFVRPQGPLLPL